MYKYKGDAPPSVMSVEPTGTPRFAVGQRIWHVSKLRYGLVESIINRNVADDILNQGYRYAVRFSDKTLWSIPDEFLATEKPRKEAKNLNNFKGTKSNNRLYSVLFKKGGPRALMRKGGSRG